jgi:hypothetical protein
VVLQDINVSEGLLASLFRVKTVILYEATDNDVVFRIQWWFQVDFSIVSFRMMPIINANSANTGGSS